jgi:Fibronectin type III domain
MQNYRRNLSLMLVIAALLTACGKAGEAPLAATTSPAGSKTATGSATLSWVPPTKNSDGSELTQLAGYYIYYGTRPTDLSQVVQLKDPQVISYEVTNLRPGTYYFCVVAYTEAGAKGSSSPLVSKIIR